MATASMKTDSGCPTISTLQTIGKSWTCFIVLELFHNGARNFNTLVRDIKGISPKELSAKLAMLEQDDIVKKAERAYTLTAKGQELAGLLREFKAFNQRWHPELPSSCAENSCASCTVRLAE